MRLLFKVFHSADNNYHVYVVNRDFNTGEIQGFTEIGVTKTIDEVRMIIRERNGKPVVQANIFDDDTLAMLSM